MIGDLKRTVYMPESGWWVLCMLGWMLTILNKPEHKSCSDKVGLNNFAGNICFDLSSNLIKRTNDMERKHHRLFKGKKGRP
jgi:hypothetical protein